MTDEDVIRSALKVVGSYISAPRDMISLCKYLGIKIKPLSLYLENGFTEHEFFTAIGNKDGAASCCNGTYYIFYNDFQPYHRIRFTLAEEIMHIVLGHANDLRFLLGKEYDADLYAQYEHEAKLGAKILLMPPSLYYRLRSLYKLRKLAAIFNISEQAAFRCIKYYEENEALLKQLGSYCPRCEVTYRPDYIIKPISVWANREY